MKPSTDAYIGLDHVAECLQKLGLPSATVLSVMTRLNHHPNLARVNPAKVEVVDDALGLLHSFFAHPVGANLDMGDIDEMGGVGAILRMAQLQAQMQKALLAELEARSGVHAVRLIPFLRPFLAFAEEVGISSELRNGLVFVLSRADRAAALLEQEAEFTKLGERIKDALEEFEAGVQEFSDGQRDEEERWDPALIKECIETTLEILYSHRATTFAKLGDLPTLVRFDVESRLKEAFDLRGTPLQ